MYFTIGGRRTQSALYRIRYTGEESTAAVEPSVDAQASQLRAIRHRLEALHAQPAASPENVSTAIEHLSHEDRQIRYAARIALEHQPVDSWRSRVPSLEDANAKIVGVVALARCGQAADATAAIEVL